MWRNGDLERHGVFGEHLFGGADEAGIVIPVVLGAVRLRAEQGWVVPVQARVEERRTPLPLSVFQRVRQRFVFALWQQHDAQDGENSEGGEDHVMQEIAAVILQLHQRRRSHSHAAGGHDQTQSPATERERQLKTLR